MWALAFTVSCTEPKLEVLTPNLNLEYSLKRRYNSDMNMKRKLSHENL